MSTCKSCARRDYGPLSDGCAIRKSVEERGCQYHESKNRSNKFNARTVRADGCTFQSESEYERYLLLKEWERIGDIVPGSLRVHPKWLLFPAALGEDSLPLEAETWTADFAYLPHWRIFREVVEDVKGEDTLLSRLKRRVAIESLGLDVRVVWTGRRG